VITIDILKEQNADAKNELDELKKVIAEMKMSQRDTSVDDKERRKQEKMALMMAKFDAVSSISTCLSCKLLFLIRLSTIQQGAFSEKDEQLRQILAKLDDVDSASSLSQDDLTSIRRQLYEGQSLVRETVDRLRMSQEESEMVTRRKDELEARVTALETEYEELLGAQFTLVC
jgi:kinesin family protein 5